MSSLHERLFTEDPVLAEAYKEAGAKREIALTLRALRQGAGLTQKQLAERAGLTQSTISKMESASGSMPTTDAMAKYADACEARLWFAFPPKDKHPSVSVDGRDVPSASVGA